MEKATTCCFTGHRRLPAERIDHMIKRLTKEVDDLISKGVTNFISGGALGFDQMAATLVVAKREMGKNVRLIFALPCRDQDKGWDARQKNYYHSLLAEADEVIYVSDEYKAGCMKKRNEFMVDHSAYCISALLYQRSGTYQTVQYARRSGVAVINIANAADK